MLKAQHSLLRELLDHEDCNSTNGLKHESTAEWAARREGTDGKQVSGVYLWRVCCGLFRSLCFLTVDSEQLSCALPSCCVSACYRPESRGTSWPWTDTSQAIDKSLPSEVRPGLLSQQCKGTNARGMWLPKEGLRLLTALHTNWSLIKSFFRQGSTMWSKCPSTSCGVQTRVETLLPKPPEDYD